MNLLDEKKNQISFVTITKTSKKIRRRMSLFLFCWWRKKQWRNVLIEISKHPLSAFKKKEKPHWKGYFIVFCKNHCLFYLFKMPLKWCQTPTEMWRREKNTTFAPLIIASIASIYNQIINLIPNFTNELC